MTAAIPIALRCADRLRAKVRYVFDTLLLAGGIGGRFVPEPPAEGPWVLYGSADGVSGSALARCLAITHTSEVWQLFEAASDVTSVADIDGLAAVFPARGPVPTAAAVLPFDLIANAFYFLSSWSERVSGGGRRTYDRSVFARLGIPQDIVDRYLGRLMASLSALCESLGRMGPQPVPWPEGGRFALVLSHDVDFLPNGTGDVVKQGCKTIARHLLHHRDPADAARAAAGLLKALATGRDPYGCVPEIIAREKELGVRSSFQVAVGHRHPNDVNYRIEDDRVRDYLRVISDAGFDLCLHGSYRSTENAAWYGEEAELLAARLGRPRGSRQHFLSFDYDALFAAQERAGIRYDMSMGFPDRPGPRAGFSYPYFPYCLEEDRPFDVLQISLFLMDVTLRGYLGLKGAAARRIIEDIVRDLCEKRGCVSAVWHPIVFGGARDPGYDRLYWDMIESVRDKGGLATDGRAINAFWRQRAQRSASFAGVS
ncbi:MAG: polysaccharide deacetylase family protein [Rhodospirillales bacterium]